jgi:hypothetical protein
VEEGPGAACAPVGIEAVTPGLPASAGVSAELGLGAPPAGLGPAEHPTSQKQARKMDIIDRYEEITVSYRLTNQKDPAKTLRLSVEAWYGLLELAETHGWNPVGTGLPPWWSSENGLHGFDLAAQDNWNGDYITGEGGLVMLEDALNLADALERAFWAFEPQFTRLVTELYPDFLRLYQGKFQPGIGAIAVAAEFCRSGAFWIERTRYC